MFLCPIESFPKRNGHVPFVEPEAVYAALVPLEAGDVVPLEVYISDYNTYTIPPWTVKFRDQRGSGVLVLTLIDPNSTILATLWEPARDVARQVMTSPLQSLATPHYQLQPGYGPTSMMCDLIQQARYVVKTMKREG